MRTLDAARAAPDGLTPEQRARLRALVEKACAGKPEDVRALAEFVAVVLRSWLRGKLYRLRAPMEEVEDLLQQVYLNLLKAPLPGLSGPEKFLSYLFTIANNLIHDCRKRGQRTKGVVATIDIDTLPASERQLSLDLKRLLRELPVEEATVIVLVDWQGHSYREAAEKLKCTVLQVKKRLQVARARLRRLFGATLPKRDIAAAQFSQTYHHYLSPTKSEQTEAHRSHAGAPNDTVDRHPLDETSHTAREPVRRTLKRSG